MPNSAPPSLEACYIADSWRIAIHNCHYFLFFHASQKSNVESENREKKKTIKLSGSALPDHQIESLVSRKFVRVRHRSIIHSQNHDLIRPRKATLDCRRQTVGIFYLLILGSKTNR